MIGNPQPGEFEEKAFLKMLDRFIADDLTPSDAQRLRTTLLNEEIARLLYVEYMDLHAELGCQGQQPPHIAPDFLDQPARSSLRSGRWLSLVAGVLAVCTWLAWAQIFPNPIFQQIFGPLPVVGWIEHGNVELRSLRRFGNARDDSPQVVRELRIGDELLALSDQVTFHLQSGARAFLANGRDGSPARFAITSDNSCELKSGLAFFQVPQSASGFKVTAGAAEFVDFGTEFSVFLDAASNAEIHVLKGAVSARVQGEQKSVLLLGGDASIVGSASPKVEQIPFQPREFARVAMSAYGIEFLPPSVAFHPERRPLRIADFTGETMSAETTSAETTPAHLSLEGQNLSFEDERTFHFPFKFDATRKKPFSGHFGGKQRVAAQQQFDSYLLSLEPVEKQRQTATTGEIRFERPILAVITSFEDLVTTGQQLDGYLIQSSGDTIELSGSGQDFIQLSEDSKTIRYSFEIFSPSMDAIRILVATEDHSK